MTSSPQREISVDEAMSMAILFQRNGELDVAAEIYAQILAAQPEHADALHYAGVLAHQRGQSEEGLALLARSVDVDAAQPDVFSNLGIVLRALGRLDDAIAAYRHAIALDPTHANAFNNLGVACKQQKQWDDAEAAFRESVRLNPRHADAFTNLGSLLAGRGRPQEAVQCYSRAITVRPEHQETRRLMALAYSALGDQVKAAAIYEQWIADEPEHPVPRHMFAACSGRDVPSRAADPYVERVFDNFAVTFERKLASLSYQAPALVAAAVGAVATPAGRLRVLDAGCGTGLCGPLLAPFASHLVGVDLSARMLEQAAEKQVYQELVKEELTGYLRVHADAFHLIVSADTLVYFGDLDPVFAAAAAALRPGGALVVTLEAHADPSVEYHLEPHGRYSHGAAYVERLGSAHGLGVRLTRAHLRYEAGVPVDGLVVTALRPPVDAPAAPDPIGEAHG